MSPSEHSILVVEDEHSLRAAAARQLRQTYSQVLEADSVARALALLQTERVDAILVDIHLQDGSGFDIARQFSAAVPRPRLIVLSGYGSSADLTATDSAGFERHLVKPIDLDQLRSALNR